jgi:RNA polymerase sigma-70 factor (ECF subfamily)
MRSSAGDSFIEPPAAILTISSYEREPFDSPALNAYAMTLVLQQPWTDEQVIARVLDGEAPVFELLMRRHNQRVYRAVRSILKDEAEAEDAMQAAYLHAYAHLRDFEARSSFITWLTRIAIHEALARKKRQQRTEPGDTDFDTLRATARNPEEETLDSEHRQILASAIDELPEHYRTVFVLRQVQELSQEETARCLEINEGTVKTRLHRARALLRRKLLERFEPGAGEAMPFHATRCDRVVAFVLLQILPRN